MPPLIEMRHIDKIFNEDTENELQVLFGIDLAVPEGEFLSVVGQSGSGKSTLMNIIGALDKPSAGSYTLGGEDVGELDDNALSDIRNQRIGFVFQTFNLIPRCSALRNVELPMLYMGVGRGERVARAKELLEVVGMGDRMDHMPNELSGGQKQRVAIARAMACDPQIILADEPTGALDSKTGRSVMDLFHRLHEAEGKTILLITHNEELARETERIVTIRDGRIVSDTRPYVEPSDESASDEPSPDESASDEPSPDEPASNDPASDEPVEPTDALALEVPAPAPAESILEVPPR